MPLDVVHIDRLPNARVLVELAQVAGQIAVVGDPPLVALEVADVDSVEADQGYEKAPVSLGDRAPGQEALLAEAIIDFIQSLEEIDEGFFVGRPGWSRSRSGRHRC